jgi:hypothetical protein
MQRGLLLDDITLSFKALLLFSEAAFKDSICRDYLHGFILDTISGQSNVKPTTSCFSSSL